MSPLCTYIDFRQFQLMETKRQGKFKVQIVFDCTLWKFQKIQVRMVEQNLAIYQKAEKLTKMAEKSKIDRIGKKGKSAQIRP